MLSNGFVNPAGSCASALRLFRTSDIRVGRAAAGINNKHTYIYTYSVNTQGVHLTSPKVLRLHHPRDAPWEIRSGLCKVTLDRSLRHAVRRPPEQHRIPSSPQHHHQPTRSSRSTRSSPPEERRGERETNRQADRQADR